MSRRRIHYAWFVAGVTFVILLGAAAVRATPSLLIVPLHDELGWSTQIISGAVSLNLVLFGLIGPFAAAVMQRFGIRRTVLAALVVIAAGVESASFVRAPWQLYASWGAIVGLATGVTASVLGATIAQRWFVARRGLVMGLLTASSATGQLVFLPVMATFVESDGWRPLTRAIAIAVLALVPIVMFILRDHPDDVGLRPYGADPDAPVPPRPAGNPLALALGALGRATKHRDFWLLAVSFFVCGATTNGLIGTHLVPACMDHGIPEVRAAKLIATMGIFDLFGTTASGWLTDRHDARRLLFVYYGLRGLALIYLPIAFGVEVLGLPAFAVFYGLDWIATVPPTLRLTVDAVGPVDGPIVFGWLFTAHQLGAGAGALAAGVIRTQTGAYTPAWLGAGLICLVAAVIVLRIGATRKR
ncbi:MAG TPA: MFS transporter [Kofleriaceae bacterium]|nr:MFS transporter [Kofleriaceae bacterium]